MQILVLWLDPDPGFQNKVGFGSGFQNKVGFGSGLNVPLNRLKIRQDLAPECVRRSDPYCTWPSDPDQVFSRRLDSDHPGKPVTNESKRPRHTVKVHINHGTYIRW